MSEQSAKERPSNKEVISAVDWLAGDGEDIEFDSADWSGADVDGVVTTEGYVVRDDGKHYIQAQWRLVGVFYDPNPIDSDDDYDIEDDDE